LKNIIQSTCRNSDAYMYTECQKVPTFQKERNCVTTTKPLITTQLRSFRFLFQTVIHFFYSLQIYNPLYNRAISKYVIRKHLCGVIIRKLSNIVDFLHYKIFTFLILSSLTTAVIFRMYIPMIVSDICLFHQIMKQDILTPFQF
jgi:hypothetical protein